MKLRTKYILFVTLLHLLTLGLTYFIFRQNMIFFIAAEAVIIISVVISVQLYQQLIQPMKSLMQGVEAIKDKDFNVKFLPTGKHEVDQLIGVYNDMMDELRTERTRQEQQHFFLEQMIHTSPTGIIILDFDGRVCEVNPRGLAILQAKADEVVGFLITELPNPLFTQLVSLQSGETRVVKPNAINTLKLQKSHFVDRGFSRQFIMIEDLTAELLEAEKKVYSKMIRMMAHEVNNTIGPVNSIMGSALSADKLWENHNHNTLKDALQIAIDRNQNLNFFMRDFADLVKLPPANKQRIDLHKVLQNVVALMTIKANERNVIFQSSLSPGEFIMMADEQLMEQALINIIKNAIEAISDSGTIKITTDITTKKLTITDSGKGISAEESEQIFSPFYSTKKDGQGIGLTLVREIMLSHGFEFSLQTVDVGRTEFTILFV